MEAKMEERPVEQRTEERLARVETTYSPHAERDRRQEDSVDELERNMQQLEAPVKKALERAFLHVVAQLRKTQGLSPPALGPTSSSSTASALPLEAASSTPSTAAASNRFQPPFSSEELNNLEEDLLQATRQGNVEDARMLLDQGIHVDCRDCVERTPLHWAVIRNHLGVLSLLLERGADVDAADVNGNTALHFASVNYKSERFAQQLISAGADLDFKNGQGHSPLQQALCNRNQAVIKTLIAAGCDTNSQDKKGRVALHEAVRIEFNAIVQALIAAGCDVIVQDNEGRTPLHVAADVHNIKAARALVSAGARKDLKNVNGQTPFSIHFRNF